MITPLHTNPDGNSDLLNDDNKPSELGSFSNRQFEYTAEHIKNIYS